VFVEAGATGGNGTRDNPYGDLATALADASATKPIYACNAATALAGSVSVTVSTKLYGGMDCQTWAHTDAKTALEGDVNLPALAIRGDVDVVVEDFMVTAKPAQGTDGANSTGIVVDGAAVILRRLDIIAGDGAPGQDGVTPTTAVTGGTSGDPGDPGCLSSSQVLGGTGPVTACDGGESSSAGNGGFGTATGGANSNGVSGESDPIVGGATDNHGNGQTSTLACSPGTVGAQGDNGTDGVGASITDWGVLTNGELVGAAGQDGQSSGHPGQGGGGGGGARGASVCVTTTNAGSSGGSGGSGGCGGHPAIGGGAGGSSIGIALQGGSLDLTAIAITLGEGGKGGAGADGQIGASGGGPGGAGGSGACSGGQGGQGGFGGAAGGGRGGHALGVVVSGATAPNPNSVDITGGSFGLGGASAPSATNGGEDGAVCTILDIDAGACSP
jgi:hypothetical protein